MSHLLTIAIDGPAASGKSTVGQRVAQVLDFLYFDTGAMYRAVTLLALERGMDLADAEALGRLAAETPILIEQPADDVQDSRQYTVIVEGRDITWELRHRAVDQNVSQVARHPSVRKELRSQQRKIGEQGEVVMVGRDIGTVVMPDAPLKIYLDASPEERARRRCRDCELRGEDADYETLLDEIRERDQRDSQRPEAPLSVADDAIVLDTDGLSIDEVVRQILELVKQQGWTREEASRNHTQTAP
ncbi:MAG TPA: (d)CMP kinase [Ardenticatenaceae bacterium]|jgi:cytidylate kinase